MAMNGKVFLTFVMSFLFKMCLDKQEIELSRATFISEPLKFVRASC